MCLKNCHFAACFTILWTSIAIFYVNTARAVVTVLLIFAEYLSYYLHISTCTYRGTHTQAHMYNQHTRGMEPTRHWNLVERGGRKALLETLHTHTHKRKKTSEEKPIYMNLKGKTRAHRASSKATRYFLRSNKSNINQLCVGVFAFACALVCVRV